MVPPITTGERQNWLVKKAKAARAAKWALRGSRKYMLTTDSPDIKVIAEFGDLHANARAIVEDARENTKGRRSAG